ncbi:hypothetical protein [Streptomyces sp. bgisy153]|uniref:hypothetical protein n=1 Tax=Streptomyces sp. bgisy153 TaxID=3413793 RepID=UPI003D70E2F4
MTALIIRKGVGRDWTAADYDSYTVLAELGTPRPALLVSKARRGRPLRRAIRAALRTVKAPAVAAVPAVVDRGLAR